MVIVNVVRGGPGLGSIAPAQSDYFQSTRGGGHGDYRCIVLAPKSVQECADLTYKAFDLADKYRVPVIVLADGILGQMMEGIILPDERNLSELPKRDWIAGKMSERKNASNNRQEARHITSIHLVPEELEAVTRERFARYEKIKESETNYEDHDCAAADLVLVAYGTCARVCLGAKMLAEKEGIKLGIFRPVTLWPFPYKALGKIASTGKPTLTVEMSLGQLVEDVKLSLYEASCSNGTTCNAQVHLLGHSGGVIPTEEEVFEKVRKILGK
jgi:2-oxoglutarate ferredoxin oxidoreductase subunit alpha